MPYSDNPMRLEEMLPYLEPIMRGENVIWPIKRGNANTVAFRIREALRIAILNKERYPQLAEYANDYKIRVVNALTVEARRRTPILNEAYKVIERTVETVADVVVEAKPEPQPEDIEIIKSIGTTSSGFAERSNENLRALLGPQSPITVIDSYRRYGKVRPTLHFPNANLSDAELTELFRWATGHTPTLMIMSDAPSITVAILDPMVAEYSWKPTEMDMDELDDAGS